MRRKPHVGYDKKSAESDNKNRSDSSSSSKKSKKQSYAANLIIHDKNKKIPLTERLVKLVILVALRMVIKPSKWKDPKKNYALIDKTYDRIMSSDFVYIPSSIAFYMIMAFMPIMSMIMVVSDLDFMHDLIYFTDSKTTKENNAIAEIIGKFIPGMKDLISQVHNAVGGGSKLVQLGSRIALIVSLVISAWIAAGGFSKLIFTMSHIYGHKYVGGYWMNKFRGISMVVIFTLSLTFALAVNIYVDHLIRNSSLPYIWQQVASYSFLIVGLSVLIFCGFIVLYRFSPRYKTKIRWIVPGAMTSAIPTILFLAGFGPITSFWDYSSFGAIGAIMYLAMAALFVIYFIFVGIIVNASYHKTFIGKVEKKWTFSRK